MTLDRLGPYRIDTPLGAGGMGQVFLATDTRLHRMVAIKVLPSDRVTDPDRRQRFLQEARAASALNHPHIVTLYDIATDNGIDYLVMEYVRGKTLDALIPPDGLPLAQVVNYAEQIAKALAAAHHANIVHRDIKPANLIVTADDHIKVLDFGLAKLEAHARSPEFETKTASPVMTGEGVVMGTAAYMSPEQARGEAVDSRSDLFSLGAVLYEMACGRRPFQRPYEWTVAPDPLPRPLRAMVMKLLAIERDRRYQTADDLLADLKRLSSANGDGRSPRFVLAGAALLTVAVAISAGLFFRPDRSVGRDQWVQLTNFPDSVSQPALSSDGRMLTFVRGADTFSAPGQIYVKVLPDGEPVQLTRDNFDKMSPVFSPDGSEIAYSVGQRDTWVVPVVTGQPRLWLQNASGLIWIDKERLLFSEVKEGIHMGIVTAGRTRGGARDVYLPASARGMAHRSYPSPDGKWSLIVEMDRGAWLPCRLAPIDGSSPGQPVGPPDAMCTSAAWSTDGKWMYFSCSSAEGSFHTWRQRFPSGELERVTSGPSEEEGIAMAPDGRSFITAVAQRQSVVWTHDVGGDRPISVEGYSVDPVFLPDGKRLCYRILKGGLTTYDPSDLRLVELDSGHNEPLLPGLSVYGPPGRAYAISPEGRNVVAAVKNADGKPQLWLAAIDRQSPPRQIPNVEGDAPAFLSEDEVLFRRLEGKYAYLYRVRQDGTGLRKLNDRPIVLLAGVSHDRQWVVTRSDVDDQRVVAASPVNGEPPMTLFTEGISCHLTWSTDGTRLFLSVPTSATATRIVGKTYVVPLPPHQMFPDIPAGGLSVADLVKRPDVTIIDTFDAFPGPTADTYAFSRASVIRNLFRIAVR